jgi:glycosyltransferase involved in cell wall biosynthesis
MMAQKRVLIVATAFPPSIGSGVRRVTGLVKYLPQCGWNPYVVTRVPSPYHAPDSAHRETQIPGAVGVIRTPFSDIRFAGKKLLLRATGKGVPATWAGVTQSRAMGKRSANLLWAIAHTVLFVPDTEIGWLPYAIRPALRVIRESGIDVILSCAPPPTAQLVALRLKRLTSKPWVADFSDPWTQHPDRWFSPLQAIRKPVDRFLERKVMSAADVIIADSQPRADGFTELKVKGIEPKLQVITNGFDPDDFVGLTHGPPDKFTITYTGTFVSKAWSPTPLFCAVSELIKEARMRREKVAVRIIEAYSQDTRLLAAQHGLSDVVAVQVGLPHADAAREQVNASVLLFMMRNDPGGFGIYTGKLFEYLGARRPILMLGPKQGVAAELIREANAGTVVDSRNPQEIKEAILKYYREFERTGDVSYAGKEEVIRRHEHPALAEKLAGILDSLVSR